MPGQSELDVLELHKGQKFLASPMQKPLVTCKWAQSPGTSALGWRNDSQSTQGGRCIGAKDA